MCEKCDQLENQMIALHKKKSITPTNWWVGILVTITIFIVSQIYLSGKVVAQIETHIQSDMTYKEMIEKFETKENAKEHEARETKRIDKMEKMVEYLYFKNGGKPLREE